MAVKSDIICETVGTFCPQVTRSLFLLGKSHRVTSRQRRSYRRSAVTGLRSVFATVGKESALHYLGGRSAERCKNCQLN
jgi:hypothetical protein